MAHFLFLLFFVSAGNFKTVAIRPVAMYGEEDPQYVTQPLKVAKKTGFWPVINCRDATHQSAYVGNVAWSFICADKALIEETLERLHGNGQDSNHSGHATGEDKEHHHASGSNREHVKVIGGNAFNIADNTPMANMFEMKNPFAAACNHSTEVLKIPLSLIVVSCYIIYFILLMLSPIVKLNFPYSVASFKQLQISYTFNCDKAADMIKYTPLFDYRECLKRSVSFYKQFAR